ncbi:MAG: fumarylacetoacetate hydrolase family protein [Candidatus Omnitrophota bacterium]
MKLARFISDHNTICYGVIESPEAKKAILVHGDIWGNFSVGTETVAVRKLLAPVVPPNIIGIGLNYARHADETGVSYPDIPVMFLKGTNTVIADGEPVVLPAAGVGEVDYEAELAVIIGKTAKNVRPEQALDYVLGYCCANDVSEREWQKNKQKKQWARGKSFDTFCPLGPWIVTRDEIADPNRLAIRTEINGVVFQSSSTADMIFPVSALISNLSQSMTLLPGTVILTGTPEGVGFTRTPPVFLKKGDTVSVIIENIGTLTNPVIEEE